MGSDMFLRVVACLSYSDTGNGGERTLKEAFVLTLFVRASFMLLSNCANIFKPNCALIILAFIISSV